jgi:uncharacterized sulfatase
MTAPDSAENLLFVICDSVRARSCLGSDTATATFKEIGDRGALYTTAVAPGVWTLPSFASMLTGQLPSEHGVVRRADVGKIRSLETLPERLSTAGVRTALVTNSYLITRLGNRAAFDMVETPDAADPLFADGVNPVTDLRVTGCPPREKYSLALREAMRNEHPGRSLANLVAAKLPLAAGGSETTADEPTGDEAILEATLSAIDTAESNGNRFSAFAHFGGVHEPWRFQPSLLDDGTADTDDRQKRLKRAAELSAEDALFNQPSIDIGTEQVSALTDLYEEQVRQVGALAARLIAGLRKRGLEDETLVVVTSDHGKVIRETYLGHGVADQDVYHVPLAVSGPGVGPGSTSEPVGLDGIYRTVLSALDGPSVVEPRPLSERATPAVCESYCYLVDGSDAEPPVQRRDPVTRRVVSSVAHLGTSDDAVSDDETASPADGGRSTET